METTTTTKIRPATAGALIVGMMFVAAALRAPMTSIPPLLEEIQHDFGLGTVAMGMLTTLPLLALAAVSPFSGVISARFGLERALFGAMIILAAGTLLRSAGWPWALYVGAWVVGGGIAVGNTLLPSLLKRDFPDRIPLFTAAYVLAMGISAGLASAVVVPLSRMAASQEASGWAPAAAAMAVWPLLAAVFWVPHWLNSRGQPAALSVPHRATGGQLWKSPIAWQVTFFLGLNSTLYYIMISWLPSILTEAGYTPQAAGSLHGLLQLATALPGLLMIPLVRRPEHHRSLAAGLSVIFGAGFLGFALLPQWAVAWTLILGIASGSTLILGLSFVGLRAATAHQAARLAGMAQSLGYLLAAAGPPLTGLLHERAHSWLTTLVGGAVVAMLMAWMAWLAGRLVQIPADF